MATWLVSDTTPGAVSLSWLHIRLSFTLKSGKPRRRDALTRVFNAAERGRPEREASMAMISRLS